MIKKTEQIFLLNKVMNSHLKVVFRIYDFLNLLISVENLKNTNFIKNICCYRTKSLLHSYKILILTKLRYY